MKIVDMEFVKSHSRGHFFDPAAMRGFRSRLAELAYVTDDDKTAYFVTSEQFVPSTGKPAPRTYSVRMMSLAIGDVSNASMYPYTKYATSRAADRAAREYADARLVVQGES